jgi:hypothetical protein
MPLFDRRWIACLGLLVLLALPARGQEIEATFQFEKGDRVAWVGSSSTNIGVWPKTMEFLLRTRHPQLELSFKKCSTGGGTFGTGLQESRQVARGFPSDRRRLQLRQ